MLKRVMVIGIVLFSVMSVTPAFAITASRAKAIAIRPIDKIVAVVNKDVITETQLEHQVALAKMQLSRSNIPVPSANVLQKNILQRMIDLKLQMQLAGKNDIQVSNSELDQAIGRIAAQNHMNSQQMYAAVQQQGLTISAFRKQIKREIMVQKLQGKFVAARVSISQQEVQDYLINNPSHAAPKYHVENILITLPDAPSPEALKKAKQQAVTIMQQLQKGANFRQLAAAESRGSAALQGGDLGWRKLAELPSAFADKVKTMKTGAVVGPIRTANGYHVIKLVGVKNNAAQGLRVESELQVIFLKKTSKTNDKALLAQLTKIRAQAMGGKKFGDLAKSYSQGASAARSGYVGWVKAGYFPVAVEKAIAPLKAGGISQPVITKHGAYLIKMVAQRKVPQSTAAREKEVQQLIFRRKLEENTQTFINNLRSQAYVKVFI